MVQQSRLFSARNSLRDQEDDEKVGRHKTIMLLDWTYCIAILLFTVPIRGLPPCE
jgi:hypothetical protein